MRLLPISLLYALFASAAFSETVEQGTVDSQTPIAEDVNDGPLPTTFNGVKVPVLPELNEDKFNSTIKDGYWFVKHHS
jgi:protein disulfide-isomerase